MILHMSYFAHYCLAYGWAVPNQITIKKKKKIYSILKEWWRPLQSVPDLLDLEHQGK